MTTFEYTTPAIQR